MATLQKQILALFQDLDPDLRDVVTQSLQIEEELISYERPRYKEPLGKVLDQIAIRILKDGTTNED